MGYISLLNGAASNQLLLVDEGVHRGEGLREMYDRQLEGLCEGASVLMEVEVIPIRGSKPKLSNSRSLKEDLSTLINMNANINESQKESLIDLLSSYMRCSTSRPGRCNLFEHKFQVNKDKPIVGYFRPIPFAI